LDDLDHQGVDDLLPISVSAHFALAMRRPDQADAQVSFIPQRLPAPPSAKTLSRHRQKDWAHIVDIRHEMTNVSAI
jgi:hypothetical protein